MKIQVFDSPPGEKLAIIAFESGANEGQRFSFIFINSTPYFASVVKSFLRMSLIFIRNRNIVPTGTTTVDFNFKDEKIIVNDYQFNRNFIRTFHSPGR